MTFFFDILPLLAQAQPVDPEAGAWGFWSFVGLLFSCGNVLYVPLLIWMAVWAVRNDPEWRIWVWIILIFYPLGPFIYFFARWIPGTNIPAPDFAQRFLRKGELQKLEIAAQQIGNAHQFIELGDALRETGQLDRAAIAYDDALAKDADNPQALWGRGWVAFHQEDFQTAHKNLSKLVSIDPAYKFGDVSLLHAKTLIALGQRDEACEHLEGHIKRWRHPEALYVLGQLYFADNCLDEARSHLQALIMDINSSPSAIARKQMSWKSKAQKLLKRIPG